MKKDMEKRKYNKEKEYGGCLWLEFPRGEDYFYEYPNRIELDSGRSALQYIIGEKDYKRLWLPLYNCPLVSKRLEPMDIELIYYNLDEEFRPQIEQEDFKEGDLFCWINYWGCMKEAIIDEIERMQYCTPADIIIDNIPAFFYPPRVQVYNIFSCRKFVGVPDGAYVIGGGITQRELPQYDGYVNYLYLLKAVERGSNEAYEDYLASEKKITERTIPHEMPEITKKVLRSLDYEGIKQKRIENFKCLSSFLEDTNLLKLNTDTVTPSVYPYLSMKMELRSELIDNKIYVSRFWKHILSNNDANAFERALAEYLIPLPIDQRYGVEDMEYIAKIVRDIERR